MVAAGDTPAVTQSPIASYVPRIVLRQLALEPRGRAVALPGSLLFADLSGFTKLSEQLARRGRESAEHLSEAIGGSFGRLLTVAYGHGGGLLKFGGDALLVFFEGDGHAERAARSAAGMVAALRAAGRVEVPGARATLRMSVGVHSGALHLFFPGRSHREPIVAGPAVSQALRMESAARTGEVLVSADTARELPEGLAGRAVAGGRLLRLSAATESPPPAAAAWTADDALAALTLSTAVRRHVASGPHVSEHRLATVAFVRFRGTDELITRVGPPAAAAALDALVSHVQDVADELGLTFVGSDADVDGGKLVLCAGAPDVTGDEEERMLRGLRRILDHPQPLPVQAGASRGTVFAGDIGPDYRRTYTVMGDTVNVAARLMGAAPAGGLYAAAAVLDRSPARFEVSELAPLKLKGKAQPVAAVAVGRPLGRPRATGPGDAARMLAGRLAEVSELRRALASARSGRGRLVELAGEPGIGKSRLVEELRLDAAGLTVLEATCERQDAGAPYAPWRELLLDALGAGFDAPPASVLERLRAAVAAHEPPLERWLPLLALPLGVQLPDTAQVARLAPAFRTARLNEVVLRLLRAMLPTPAMLVFEDVHHMDAASCALVDALVAGLDEVPWLVLTTRRDGPGGFNAAAAAPVRSLRLGPLTPPEALDLAERLTEHAPPPPHTLALAVERASGNPQFLRELLAGAAAGSGALPETIEAAATARIDRLAPADRALVRRVSVLGTSFHPRMVEHVLDDAAAAAAERLPGLADVFADAGDGWVRFRVGVVRDAAYEGLPFALRRRLHARAGEGLERELGSAADERAAILSLHFLLAGDHARAWRYAGIAGDRARDGSAHADAARLYRRALDAARGAGVSDEALAAMWIALGEARGRTGEADVAQDAFRHARRLLAGDAIALADVLRRQAELADRAGDATRAVRCAMRGMREISDEPGASGVRSRLIATLATARQRQGRFEDAIRLCVQAIAEGERAGEERAVAHACYLLDWALHDAGRAAEATHSPRALAIYTRLHDLDQMAAVLNNLGAYAFHAGRWAEATVLYRRAGNASAQAGDAASAAFGDCNVGEVLLAQGRLVAAGEALARAIRVWRGTGYDSGVAFATALLGRAAVHQGRHEEGHGLVQRAVAKLDQLGHRAEAQLARALLAEALVFAGHAERALQDVEALRPALLDRRLEPLLEHIRGCALAQLTENAAAGRALRESVTLARALDAPADVVSALTALDALEGGLEPHERRERSALLEQLGIVRLPLPPLRRGAAA